MARAKTKLKPKTVLIVDDDRVLRHALASLLEAAGFSTLEARDGEIALKSIRTRTPDLVLLDVGLPKMSGLDVLSAIQKQKSQPKVVVMTADDTPKTLVRAIRDHAYDYILKPTPPQTIVDLVQRVMAAPKLPPIEVVSARPEWLELLVPCHFEAADRIYNFVQTLDADLPDDVRDSVGQAFRELLLNAVEWGGGLDPRRKVRIACIRTKRVLFYRIADPGPGFSPDQIPHAAVSNANSPYGHLQVREDKGIRPGGFGLLMTRAMVDDLIYNEAHNEVVFVKYLDK